MSNETVENNPVDNNVPIEQKNPAVPTVIPSNPAQQPLSLNIILTPNQADGHFIHVFNRMCAIVNKNAIDKGFWEDSVNEAEKLALIHSEVSEVLESLRDGSSDQKNDKVPTITNLEAELADIVIRVMDYAQYKGCKLGEALLAKNKYNMTRPYKHGKKF